MSGAKLDGTNDVRSGELLAGREADGQQGAGEAAPSLAGSRCPDCGSTNTVYGRGCWHCACGRRFRTVKRAPASGPASAALTGANGVPSNDVVGGAR